MAVALNTTTSPAVQDPFGPDFKLECPICREDIFANPGIQSCYLFDCNANRSRASAIDKICIDLAKASLTERTVEWINEEDMTIDRGMLGNTTVLNAEEKGLLDNQVQLLNEEGYFNLDAVHGVCQDCIKRYVDIQNHNHESLKCVLCRIEPDDRLNPIFRSAALDLKIKGDLDLKNAADSNPLFVPSEPIQISPSLRRRLANSRVVKIAKIALGCITLVGMLYGLKAIGITSVPCLGLSVIMAYGYGHARAEIEVRDTENARNRQLLERLIHQSANIHRQDDVPSDPQPSQAPLEERSSEIVQIALGLFALASMAYVAYHVAAFMIVQLRQIAPRWLPSQPSRYLDLV